MKISRDSEAGMQGRAMTGYEYERRTGAMLYVKLVATAVFWGGTFVAARIVAREAGPFSASFLRFAVASLFLLGFVVKSHGKLPLPRVRDLFPLLMLGLTGVFAYNVFFFSGLKTVTASRASLIVAANPAFIALFSALMFKERLSLLKVLGIVLSVSGAAVVVSKGDPAMLLKGGLGLGELYIFGCVASWVSYSLIGKVAMKNLSPLLAVTYSCVIGAVCLFFPALQEGIAQGIGRFSASVWLGIFFLGFFGSALGFFWYYEGIREIGPSSAGVFINIVPVSAVLLAFFLLHEALDASLLAGALLVITGVFLTNRS
jgi:drug/metabolite transporter (DMT)-like permease